MADDGPKAIALHTSWRGRLTSFVGPFVLLVWGGYGLVAGGLGWVNGVLLALGSLFALVVLFDYPLSSTIGPDGIVRRCALRSEHLDWSAVRTIARPGARQRFPTGRREQSVGGTKQATGRAGLVAEVGKRPYLLVDRIESVVEHDALERALRTWAPAITIRAARPPEGTPPTWLYKRRKSEIEGMVDWR